MASECVICGLNATVFVAYPDTPVRGYCPRCAEDLDIFDPRPDIDVTYKDYEQRGFRY